MNATAGFWNRRRVVAVVSLFLLVYLGSLALLLPDRVITRQLETVLGRHLNFQRIEVRDGQWLLHQVSLPGSAAPVIDRVTVTPKWLALFKGEIGARLHAQHEGLHLEAHAARYVGGMKLSWQGQANALTEAVFGEWLPLPTWQSGALRFDGQLSISADGGITDGSWRAHCETLSLQGISLASINLAAVWQNDHFTVTGDSSGDVRASLNGKVSAKLVPQPSASIDALLQIDSAPGHSILSQMLPKDALQLELTGPLNRLRARCANAAQCPAWVAAL